MSEQRENRSVVLGAIELLWCDRKPTHTFQVSRFSLLPNIPKTSVGKRLSKLLPPASEVSKALFACFGGPDTLFWKIQSQASCSAALPLKGGVVARQRTSKLMLGLRVLVQAAIKTNKHEQTKNNNNEKKITG